MITTCVHVGCENVHYARGLCYFHYKYLHKRATRIAARQNRLAAKKRKETTMATTRRTPTKPRPPRPKPLDWLDYQRLQAALDDPATSGMAWLDGAPCTRSTVNMFPGELVGVSKAKAVCATCDPDCVYSCLAYALMAAGKSDDFGVYGNTSQRERSKIRGKVNVTVRAKVSDRGVRV